MVLDSQRWLELRRFRAQHESGLSVAEIARETGLNRRTVKKYLSAQAPPAPPQPSSRAGSRAQVLAPFTHVIDAWLRAELLLKATVIHERLVEQYGFTGNYQRVKLYLQQARPRIAGEMGIGPDELAGLHRRFEVVPGAQAQVDWGDEGSILAHVGIAKVYSFHMVCRTRGTRSAASPPARIWRRSGTATGGRSPTSVGCPSRSSMTGPRPWCVDTSPRGWQCRCTRRRSRSPGMTTSTSTCWRPIARLARAGPKRQVTIVRDHVLAGRGFSCVEELDAAFMAWVAMRRARTHRTHGEVIGVRAARDHAALRPLPARRVRPRQLVEVRASAATITLHATVPDAEGNTLLATHARAVGRGARIVDPAHWDGLPDGHTRAVTTGEASPPLRPAQRPGTCAGLLQALLNRAAAAQVIVDRRPLSVYDQIAGTGPFIPASRTHLKDTSS